MFSHEIESNKILQWALGALIFNYFLVFSVWVRDSLITPEAVSALWYRCPPYFQSCDVLYFLHALPDGYSQTIFYMCLFTLLLWVVYLLSQKEWRRAQIALLFPFAWHFLNVFVFTTLYAGNYEYYVFIFGVILLFLPHKEFFLKLSLVVFYMLSSFAKIHPAWIEGGYFTALKLGLPVFPDWSIPFWTNLVMGMEMVGAWFLFSKNQLLQRGVLLFFITFHLYSGIFVEYRYPATVLPFLLITFGPWYRHTPVPLDKRSMFAWGFFILLFFCQISPKLISGDEKLTLEGNQYGLYMFESNHQCISTVKTYYEDGTSIEGARVYVSARYRCDPYTHWFWLHQVCERNAAIQRMSWTFDHSINGGPFLRVVNVPDVCSLTYKPFSHNEWIKRFEDNPEIIGYPVQNYFH